MLDAQLSEALERAGDGLGDNDRSFLRRVYETPGGVYADRIRAVGLVHRARVLDAGCGFGQWSLQLAGSNDAVDALDVDPRRLALLDHLAGALGVANLRTHQGRLEALPFDDGQFDGVLCYGAIFCTDWKQALRELARVLGPEGRLYVTGCGLGWYLHLWKDRPNATADHDPRETAAHSFLNTIAYARTPGPSERGHVIIERPEMLEEIARHPLHVVGQGDEGTVHLDPAAPNPKPFFRGSYEGHPGCYEIVADKS